MYLFLTLVCTNSLPPSLFRMPTSRYEIHLLPHTIVQGMQPLVPLVFIICHPYIPLHLIFNPWHACAAKVTVVVPCVCVSVCPGLASATHATTRPSRHTCGLSIVLVIWRFSYNGLVSKIAIALPYSHERTVVGHFYTRNGLIFRIPSVYYARDFTRAVNLYAHV